jgi:hypothetical protein
VKSQFIWPSSLSKEKEPVNKNHKIIKKNNKKMLLPNLVFRPSLLMGKRIHPLEKNSISVNEISIPDPILD